jgi:excisionase family DNA binding protein
MSEIIQKDTKPQGIRNPFQMGQAKRLFNIKEAAFYLGRTEGALREMLYAGKLRFVREDKRIHLDIQDMDAWIEGNKTQHIS